MEVCGGGCVLERQARVDAVAVEPAVG